MIKELKNWKEEQTAAYLYLILAEIESGTPRQRLFTELARESQEQARIWADSASRMHAKVPSTYRPNLRARLVGSLTRWFGPHNMRGVLAAMKVRGMSVYLRIDPGHPAPEATSGMERRHRGLASGGNLRAAVFGVN